MTRLMMLVLLFVAGCAGAAYQWRHPDGLGPEVFARDQAFCHELAEQEARRAWNQYVYDQQFWYRDSWSYGRRSRLYLYDLEPPSFRYWEYRDHLQAVCLQTRGWQWVPVPASP